MYITKLDIDEMKKALFDYIAKIEDETGGDNEYVGDKATTIVDFINFLSKQAEDKIQRSMLHETL